MTTIQRLRWRSCAILAVTALVTAPASLAGASPVTATTADSPWFADMVGSARQVVAVTGDDSSRAVVGGWEKSGGQWTETIGDLPGWVGDAGMIERADDDVPATPAGVFTLPSAFGTDPAPDTALPYRRTGPNDWWVGDVSSSLYNQFYSCKPGTCPFKESESEQLDDESYSLAVVMGVNPRRVPGAGNALFLHVTEGAPTEGCVTVDKADLKNLIGWLKPGAVIAVRKAPLSDHE